MTPAVMYAHAIAVAIILNQLKEIDDMKEFMDQVAMERLYQARKLTAGGTLGELDRVDDEKNVENDFVGFIVHYSTRWFTGGFRPYGREAMLEFRRCMVKVAALAYAAYMWAGRRLDEGETSRDG